MTRFLPALLLSLFTLALTSNTALSQGNVEQCASHLLHNQLLQSDPDYAAQMIKNEQHIQQFIQNQNSGQQQLSTSGVFTIPVVVHIIHTGQSVGTGANISDTQINSAITALNDRFRKTAGTHGDAGGVDVEIEFCLAQRDPSCNATTGIVRVNGSSVTDYSTEGINAGGSTGAVEEDVKALSRWPNTDYVNIWVVTEIENNNGGGGIQGYAYFPGASAEVDGIVIMHTAFGTTGTVNSWNNLCRTLTHEMGHLLNLYHTFEGDNSGTQCPSTGNNCGSGVGDCCGDTEIHIRSSSNCPSGTNSCTSQTYGSVVNNYMDYSSQTCADEFTADQKTRMRAAACGPRASLLTSLGCTPVTVQPPGSASCVPQTTNLSNNFGMGIRNVTIHDMDVSSSNSVNDGGYVDRTCNHAANLDPSTLYSVSIHTGTVNDQDVRVYIDYNDDGDFLDAGEQIFSNNSDTLHTGTFTTPSNPTQGDYIRMRVISDWQSNTITNSCYTPQYGQVEDYSVIFSAPSVALTVTGTDVTCFFDSDGTATANASAGTTPYTYSWSTGASTQLIAGLGPGTYTCTVTDASASTASASITINEPTQLTVTVSSTNVSCNGGSDGTLTGTAIGGTTPYTYTWSNGGSMASMTGLSSNTYTLVVTDNNGCTDFGTTTITQPTALNLTSTVSNVTVNGGSDGSINLTPSGGTGSYTYAWSNSATSQDINSLTAGTYTVTVTDANGCTETLSATVTQPVASVALTVSGTDVSCFLASDGSATASPSGGTTPYTYNWSTGGSTQTITGLGPGTYTCTVTDAAASTASASVTINEPTQLTLTVTSTDASCNGVSDGTLTGTVTGGTSPYTYNWSNGGSMASMTGLSANTYTLTVTDNNGCTQVGSTTISQPNAINLTSTVSNVTVNGGSDGSIDLTPSGGTGSYTYAWSNSATSQDLSNLTAGTYTVTVTDANGCIETLSATVTQPTTSVAVTATGANVNCFGGNDGSATATASGGTSPYTYAWSNSGTTQTISGLTAATYTVTVTDNSGSTATASVVISQPNSNPTLTVIQTTNVACGGQSTGGGICGTNGGTPPYTYTWSSGALGASQTGLSAGTYTVTGSDANGCTDVISLTITEPPAITVTAVVSNVTTMGGSDGEIDLTVTGGTSPYTYNWSNAATSQDINTLIAGTYTVTVTDNNACTDIQTYTVTQPMGGALTLTVTSTNISCNGAGDGTATANASGGSTPYTYAWSNAGTTATISSLGVGTYTVTVTDNSGSTQTGSASVVQPFPLSAGMSSITQISCNGANDGAATVSVTGGVAPFTYLWSNTGTTPTQSNLSAGAYTVTVTDLNGCTATATAGINQPLPLSITGAITNVSVNGGSDGEIDLTVTGGTPTYTYLWSNSSTLEDQTNLVAGVYSVTVTDANGCTDSASFTVTEPGVNVVASIASTNVSCNGASDGTATASATGGMMPYTYNWSTSATTAAISSLSAGTYTVTVTDNNGSTNTAVVTITEPFALSVAINATDPSCNNASDGICGSAVTGGTGPFTFNWSNAATTPTITNLTAGTYSVTVIDNNGCVALTTATLNNPAPISTTLAMTPVSVNGGNDGSIDLTATGGTSPYNFLWSNAATTEDINNLTAGTYTVTVTDANGCTGIDSVAVTEPGGGGALAIALSGSNLTCNGSMDGSLNAIVSGGTTPYTYLWNNTANTASITNLAAGAYTVTVSDASGSTQTASATLTEPTAINLTLSGTDALCANQANGSASAQATGGAGGFSYNWSSGQTAASITGLLSGWYFVTATDSNGCTANDSVFVGAPAPVTASITPSGTITICPGSSTTLNANTSVGIANTWYLNGNFIASGSSLSVNQAGTYGLVNSNLNGCSSDTAFVTVIVGNLTASISGLDPSYCLGAPAASMSGSPAGGTFSGPGVVGNSFVSDSAGVGTWMVVYTYNDPSSGCSAVDSQAVTVLPTPDASPLNGQVTVQPNQTYLYNVTSLAGTSYSWSVIGGTLGSQANNIAQITWGAGPLGQVIVTAVSDLGCTDTDTFNIFIGIVSVGEPGSESTLTVYPNPAREQVFLQAEDGFGESVTLEVMDATGQLVYREVVNGNQGPFNRTLDVSAWSGGIYFLRAVNATGVGTYRLVVH